MGDSGATGAIIANLVGIAERRVSAAEVVWIDGVIRRIRELGRPRAGLGYLLPGFVDAHLHVESSLLTPTAFAQLAVRHGTVACVCDPHEIANVLGGEGVRFLLREARQSPFHFLFGAPSCVPATAHETAGAELDAAAVAALLEEPGIGLLSEIMNVPAVLAGDPAIYAKIASAHRLGLPVDGHAPGVRGEALRRYIAAGISTDHECSTLDEALEKLAAGMRILIREGSAARNFEALQSLLSSHPGRVMLCSDDRHPDDLLRGHIDRLVARAVAAGCDPFDVLQAACLNPVRHYRLPVGMLRVGDPMDAIEVGDLVTFRTRRTWLAGTTVWNDGLVGFDRATVVAPNRFAARAVASGDLTLSLPPNGLVRVIDVEDGQLLTGSARLSARLVPDPEQDVLLLAVVNRYAPMPPAVALVRGFGLRAGALASSVAHDSHNVVGVGGDATALQAAMNAVIGARGGLAVASPGGVELLSLPVAGLMSDRPGDEVASRYARLERSAQQLGSPLRAPLMMLSFLTLLVVPELKLSDRGLFDSRDFRFTNLVV